MFGDFKGKLLRIVDFGLSVFQDIKFKLSGILGSPMYMAP